MPLIDSVEEAQIKSFDYVIIGAGAAGLTLAQRLSDDPGVSVLVLEAGEAFQNDSSISRPGQQGSHLGNPKYDWGFQTVPQKHLNGRAVQSSRGKGLGGSTAIHFLGWSIPHHEDVNDWERLGNQGWNWETYQKYVNKNLHFTPRDASLDKIHKEVVDEVEHPYQGGNMHISYPKVFLDMELKFQEAMVAMGIPRAKKPMDGENIGVSFAPSTLDPNENTRAYSGSVYLSKYQTRPNLYVLTKAYVTRVRMEDLGLGESVATGVEFYQGNSRETKHVLAKREVVLSAGTLKTPHILELSGIGKKEVLEKIGVPVKLDLDVGENVQEHVLANLSYQLKDDSTETFDILREEGQLERHLALHPQGKGVFNMGYANYTYAPLSSFSSRASAIYAQALHSVKEKIATGNISKAATASLEAQLSKVERGAPDCEIISLPLFLSKPNPPVPGKKYLTVACVGNHLWSRGTLHAISADPTVDPAYDPHYLEEKADLELLLEVVKFARKLVRTSPLKDILVDPLVEDNPGLEVETDEQIKDWIQNVMGTVWHTVGSASMLPKEKGGVVDSRLKVYGTTNLRVADLSVVPSHISAHTQATAYMIGEYAADIIKGAV